MKVTPSYSPVLEVSNLEIGHPGHPLIPEVNAVFDAGTLTAVVGRNGAGKSTFLRLLCGLNPVASGRVKILGEDIRKIDVQKLAKLVSFISSSRQAPPEMTVAQAVALGRAPYTPWHGKLTSEDISAVEVALKRAEVEGFASRKLLSLSDGEAQRVMIARAIAQDTPLMILDEPTSFLDIPGRNAICRLLARLAKDHGKTILFSTHEVQIAAEYCQQFALLNPPNFYFEPTNRMLENNRFEIFFK